MRAELTPQAWSEEERESVGLEGEIKPKIEDQLD